MEYKELKSGITTHLNNAAEDFFMVGYFLRQISENALFVEDGYTSIWEFAKGEYGLSTSSASRFMAINARFSIDGGEHMAEKYIGMGVSKLQEMLGLPDEELEKITKETTVREIRAMKKKQEEPLSFFGFPKTVRPEGSLITTPGCGDGKYDCFSCSRECGIRQEERYCRTATMGKPFPCLQLNSEEWKRRIQFSMYKDECQLLHQELAPVRAGDREPDPCCLHCEHKSCFNRCDVAKKEDDEERKAQEAARRQEEREREAARPEPTEKDIAAFYKWAGFKTGDQIKAEALKQRYRNAGGDGGRELKDYQGSARGIRINHKKELTWGQLAKRLTEHQEKERQAEEAAAARFTPEEKAPEIIDADFREVEEPKSDREKKELLKEKEPEFITAFYKSLYPGEKETIKTKKPADITKMLKKEHGESYDGGNDGSGLLWNCYPDKICFSLSGLGAALQLTWGKYTTKLLRMLEERPEIETEPEVVEVQDEPKDDPAQEAAAARDEREEDEEPEEETKNENQEAEIVEQDPEHYEPFDVWMLFKDHEKDLQAYRDAGMPDNLMQKQRILTDALQLLYSSMKEVAEDD